MKLHGTNGHKMGPALSSELRKAARTTKTYPIHKSKLLRTKRQTKKTHQLELTEGAFSIFVTILRRPGHSQNCLQNVKAAIKEASHHGDTDIAGEDPAISFNKHNLDITSCVLQLKVVPLTCV